MGGTLKHSPYSQPLSVPNGLLWFVAGAARSGARTLVALSGMHRDDREQCLATLKQLGVSCTTSSRCPTCPPRLLNPCPWVSHLNTFTMHALCSAVNVIAIVSAHSIAGPATARDQAGVCCPRWELGVTHLVLPGLVRNVQVLAALASGCWLLHRDFLAACKRSHAWMEPVRPHPAPPSLCACLHTHCCRATGLPGPGGWISGLQDLPSQADGRLHT